MNVQNMLGFAAMLCTAYMLGKLLSKIKLPAILGWLIAGIVFGPHLGNLVSQTFLDNRYYKIFIKVFECFAGVMIGAEINFKRLKSSGSKIIVTTLFQSLGTFATVSLFFAVTFLIMDVPLYLAFVFGGIALATAPAPALSIVNEYKTKGPVTNTLLPMAALDDVVGVVVFFTVISIVSATVGGGDVNVLNIVLMIFLPFIVGIAFGALTAWLLKHIKNARGGLAVMILMLPASVALGLVCDYFIFKSFSINYLLIGMAFSTATANLVKTEQFEKIVKLYNPLLFISLIVVIVNLGMPLDYRAIAGAGLYTAIYIVSRAIGKIGGAYVGGKITKSEKTVQKYLGLTLLPHSGVSLVFTGIAVTTLSGVNNEVVQILQGTIAAAAIINEIIAVILAKQAFKMAGEIPLDKKNRKPVFWHKRTKTVPPDIPGTQIDTDEPEEERPDNGDHKPCGSESRKTNERVE